MEGLIDRQKAIIKIVYGIDDKAYFGDIDIDWKVIYFLNSLPSVTPKEKTGWIPVSEGLPEDRQRVLVTVVRYSGDKITRLAEYYSRNNGKGIFQIQENHEEWEVGEKGLLAWMPLPEPYKEVSE